MRVPVAVAGLGQRFEVAGVGELVDVRHRPVGVADDVTDDGRADEPRAAGDQDLHGFVLIAARTPLQWRILGAWTSRFPHEF